MPCWPHAALNSRTMRSRSAAEASIGTRSLSCRLTPQAPSSASMRTASTGGSGTRTASPKGSRPRLPTVQRPKENLSSLRGVYSVVIGVSPRSLLIDGAQGGVHARELFVAVRHHVRRRRVGSGRRRGGDHRIAGGVDRWPDARADAGEQRRAVSGAFLALDGLDRAAVRIGLNLTPERRTRATAADAHARNRDAQLAEDLEGVAQAERDAFEHRAHDVAARVLRGQPEQRRTDVGVAMRRA